MTRKCSHCGCVKSINEFASDRRELLGKAYRCKVCDNNIRRNNHIKKKFNISADAYEDLLNKQNGVCAICNLHDASGQRLAVDHEHETGRIRGLLCFSCNVGLGKFREDIAILSKAINYISRSITSNETSEVVPPGTSADAG